MRLLTISVAVVLGFTALTAAPAYADGEIMEAGGPDAIPNSYLVVYKTEQGAAKTTALAAAHDARVTHTYRAALQGFAAQMGEAQAKRLAANPAVAFVAQDRKARLNADQPNPPSWGLDRVDQRNRPLNANYHFDTTASNVHVYVIDTGIRVTHVDFGGRATFDVNTVGGPNTDCAGHGTHVAGTVGGSSHGVAKGVRLHAVKVLDCGGFGSAASVVAGVDWVTANRIGPAVANMSLGFSGGSTPVDNAVRNSINSGVTYVVSAGNSNANACGPSPARVAQAVTVGASTINDARASFSNFGGCVDLFAPGQGIRSAYATSDTATAILDGTSMSSPHVTGAAALYLATNPGAGPGTVRDNLVFNGSQNRLSGVGSGSPNVLLFTLVIPPAPGTNAFVEGQGLNPGQLIRSNVGNHELIMQTDGNLVQYQGGLALWWTGTQGNPGAFAVMQFDGNFVIYRPNGQPIFATNTGGTAANVLVTQDDGNVVLYGPGGQVFWHK